MLEPLVKTFRRRRRSLSLMDAEANGRRVI
jgi:hypothetical protein